MDLRRGLPFLAFTLATLSAPGLARAATAQCVSPDGTCQVSNDGFDWIDCMCNNGSGGGGGGGNAWAGLSEMELQPICEEQLANFCGPFVPPDYLECWGLLGSCIIDNDPEDLLECWCFDGSGVGMSGGMTWAGWTDVQLIAECEAQLDATCVPPPGSIDCSNTNGECMITNVPEDFLACECNSGDGFGYGGGNAWAGYSELQLHNECGQQLVSFCGGPLPPPPWLECSSNLGDCIIDNDPEDLLECTCADGETISSSGGNAWAGLSNEELFMECEEQLFEGCAASEESGSGTDSGGSSDGDTGSSSGSSTGEPGSGTGIDGSGSSGGTPPPASTGDDISGSGSEGSEGGAADGGSGGGCSCSSTGGSQTGGWALALLGLVGVRWRRRAARAGRRERA